MPRPESSTVRTAAPSPALTVTSTEPAAGFGPAGGRRGMADRVVEQDDDELPKAGRVAAHRDRLGVDPDRDAGGTSDRRQPTGSIEGQLAEVGRSEFELDRAGVSSGQGEEVLDEFREPLRPGVDVVEGGPHLGDGSIAMPPEVLDAATNDRQRRSQLVTCVGGELALPAHRVADRDEGALRVQPSDAERGSDRDNATRDENEEENGERPLLVGSIAEDLDEQRPLRRGNGHRQYAPRHAGDRRPR